MAKQKFPRYYNQTDFGLTANVDTFNGKWTEVGALQTPAQQEIAFGIGQASFNGVDTRKNITIRFDCEAGTQLHGIIRLAIANANKTDIRIVMEDRTENLDDGVALAETKLRAKEDSYLLIYFNPDVSATNAIDKDNMIDFDDANTTILAPATVYQ